ncbi:hypothetical protein KUTeg_009923 [Tegillarca granosa]|uniref:Uncharacterized protein n=1 Tax=Tegillarca granosa TaxID=220873 RepID=A0ABQ9F8D8_TEGGR|nr:hypothetical protein KUTeg_009923 [Tegillarca granosa]
MELDTQVKQIFAAIWAVLEILVFGGLLFGWGSLVYVLKKEGVYSNLCDFEKSKINDSSIENVTVWNFIVNTTYHNHTGLDDRGRYNTSFHDGAADVDDNTDITSSCVQQDKLFNLGFAVTTALFTYGNLAASQINYKFGTRLTRLIFIGMFYVGAIMLAFVSTVEA